MHYKLTSEERAEQLESLPLWTAAVGRDAIERSLRFADLSLIHI